MVCLALRSALLEPAAGRDVDFAPEDRLEPAIARVVVEDDRREQVAMLGHRERRHLEPDRLVQQLVDPARAVEERELGMNMEMDKLGAHVSAWCSVPGAWACLVLGAWSEMVLGSWFRPK